MPKNTDQKQEAKKRATEWGVQRRGGKNTRTQARIHREGANGRFWDRNRRREKEVMRWSDAEWSFNFHPLRWLVHKKHRKFNYQKWSISLFRLPALRWRSLFRTKGEEKRRKNKPEIGGPTKVIIRSRAKLRAIHTTFAGVCVHIYRETSIYFVLLGHPKSKKCISFPVKPSSELSNMQ